jgi:hypothetical protein
MKADLSGPRHGPAVLEPGSSAHTAHSSRDNEAFQEEGPAGSLGSHSKDAAAGDITSSSMAAACIAIGSALQLPGHSGMLEELGGSCQASTSAVPVHSHAHLLSSPGDPGLPNCRQAASQRVPCIRAGAFSMVPMLDDQSDDVPSSILQATAVRTVKFDAEVMGSVDEESSSSSGSGSSSDDEDGEFLSDEAFSGPHLTPEAAKAARKVGAAGYFYSAILQDESRRILQDQYTHQGKKLQV